MTRSASRRSPLRLSLTVLLTLAWACSPSGSGSGGADVDVSDGAPADLDLEDMAPMDDAEPSPDTEPTADAGPEPDAGMCAPRWPNAAWNQRIDDAPLDPQSAEIIAGLRERGGWGNNDRFQIDFSIEVLTAGPEIEPRPFEPTQDHFAVACDVDPVPVPPGGALEGEVDYRCTGDGDCHLIVWRPSTGQLYEMWRADIDGDTFRGGCLAVWDTAVDYSAEGRGDHCTSADAAGLPIAPLLFRPDEVAAGRIDHAIRFILPNTRLRNRTYVRPATHATGAASAGEDGVPYGARLRLRADYPLDTLEPGARVVAEALQRYGMIMADGGQIALTAQSDRFADVKWDGLLGPHDLRALQVEDFEVVELGERIAWTGDCVRVDPPAVDGVCPPGPRP